MTLSFYTSNCYLHFHYISHTNTKTLNCHSQMRIFNDIDILPLTLQLHFHDIVIHHYLRQTLIVLKLNQLGNPIHHRYHVIYHIMH